MTERIMISCHPTDLRRVAEGPAVLLCTVYIVHNSAGLESGLGMCGSLEQVWYPLVWNVQLL